jgi:hypothetical protein
MRRREDELRRSPKDAWNEMMETVLTRSRPEGRPQPGDEDYIEVTPGTRWG